MAITHIKGLNRKSLPSTPDLTKTITRNFKTHYKANSKSLLCQKKNVSQTFPCLCSKIFIHIIHFEKQPGLNQLLFSKS